MRVGFKTRGAVRIPRELSQALAWHLLEGPVGPDTPPRLTTLSTPPWPQRKGPLDPNTPPALTNLITPPLRL